MVKRPLGNNSAGLVFCDSADSLREVFALELREAGPQQTEPPFSQEKIEGEVIYRPLRMYSDGAGMSVIRESTAHPRIADITSILAAATAWTRFLGLDFLVEHRTGTPFLIYANPRPNLAVQLGFVAGIDRSGMLLEVARGHTPKPVSPPAVVRVRSALLD